MQGTAALMSWGFVSRPMVQVSHICNNTGGDKLCKQFISLAGN